MRSKSREDTTRYSAIAIGFARAEHRIGLVHNDDDRAERADGHQNSHLLALGVADPLRAEFSHLHHRQTAFARKTINEKGFSNADPARDENAPLEHVGFSVLDEPGQFAKFLFRGSMGGDAIEADTGLRIFEA